MQASYDIGVAKPCSIYVNTYGTSKVDLTDGEIADILSIARWTVVTYLQNAKIKLNCSNRTSAVATALSLGIIEMPGTEHLM